MSLSHAIRPGETGLNYPIYTEKSSTQNVKYPVLNESDKQSKINTVTTVAWRKRRAGGEQRTKRDYDRADRRD